MSTLNVQPDYNRDGKVLNRQQLLDYEKNGFIVIKNVVPNYDLQRYLDRFREICEGENTNTAVAMTVMRDIAIAKSEFKKGEKAITKIQDFNEDPVLFDFCSHPAIVDVVDDLIGTKNGSLMSMHTMLINKPPDSGKLTSRHPMHQDLQYFPFRPANFICCAWTAMERVHRGNGCLVVVPGTHHGPLLTHEYPKWEGGVNKAYYGIQGYDPSMSRVYVEMDPGDTVFFHPLLIHGSGANRTDGFRKAISCHYANGAVCDYIDVKGTSQEDAEKEVLDMARIKLKKFGVEATGLTFADIWKGKARVLPQFDRARL